MKFSPLSNPLPPDTTILAVPSSGLSDLVSSLLINLEVLGISTASTFSIAAEPPDFSAASAARRWPPRRREYGFRLGAVSRPCATSMRQLAHNRPPRLRPESCLAGRHHEPRVTGRRLTATARLRSAEEGWLSSLQTLSFFGSRCTTRRESVLCALLVPSVGVQ